MADNSQNLPPDRRTMFRLGFRKLMEPVADFIERRLDIPLPVHRNRLRPPGALPEKQFLDTCYRCGNCVEICPAHAIRPVPDGEAACGTPYIDPDLAACVVCDGLSCMKVCPSGALRLVDAPEAIRMGLARVEQHTCLRRHGEQCTICIDRCPFGAQAIGIDSMGAVEVRPEGCVGCGVCQFYCPTLPKAIVVEIR
jgi:ferredoxin-type protein NapG